jgi:ABC-2 type transport system permease protein
MTTPQPRAAPAAVPSLAVRARDVLASEWTKLRSARSNYLTLLIAAVVTIGATVVVAHAFAATHGPPPPGPMTPLTESFLGYAEYTVLPVSILSVLAFTSEYSTGLIRTTFSAVPRRWAVLGAKAAVTGTAALLAGELLAFASFFLTQAILSGRHRGISLARSGVPGAVLAAGLVLAACALVGLGLGAIIRHTAGAIAATVVVIYLLAVLCAVLPPPWNGRIGRFTLPLAAYQVVALHPQASLLSPALSLLVLLAWPAAILVAAALLITRRDT